MTSAGIEWGRYIVITFLVIIISYSSYRYYEGLQTKELDRFFMIGNLFLDPAKKNISQK